MPLSPRRLASLAIALVLGGCASPPVPVGLAPNYPPPPPPGWSAALQGDAVYENKPLFGIEAEFSELTISPSGGRVVFRGREAPESYRLYQAEVGGSMTIHALADTASDPAGFVWSQDESVLYFRTPALAIAPPGAPPLVTGFTLWRLTLATGEQKAVLALPNSANCFPSPDGRYVLVNGPTGDAAPGQDGGLKILDIASGEMTPIAPSVYYLSSGYAASWRPDGKAIAVFGMRPGEPDERLTLFTAPGWERVERGAIPWSSGYVHLRWPTDGGLDAYAIGPNGALVRRRYADGQAAPEAVTFPAPGLGSGRQLYYEDMWPSREGDRVVMWPAPSSPSPEQPDPAAARRAIVSDLGTNAYRDLPAGHTPVGWLDATRLLAYTGTNQAKRLVILTP